MARVLRGFFTVVRHCAHTGECCRIFTHFCIALHRLEVNQEIARVYELIFEELRSQRDYKNAALIAEEIDRRVIILPERERGYIITHLLVLPGNVRSSCDEEILGWR